MRLCRDIFALIAVALAGPAFAQTSNIAPTHKYCWGENVGFINWRDAGTTIGAQGVLLRPTFLSGYAWGENVGWINFGSGAPANEVSYANPTGGSVPGMPDFGVNKDPATGNLAGFAWGESIGWINFSGGAMAAPALPARYDGASHRFRGFAWGESIGWVNLDDASIFVGDCPVDFNGDGILNVQDIFDFLNAWFATSPLAEFNADGLLNLQDIFDYLNAWFTGC